MRPCLEYIDLNMVRTGGVTRPEQWPDCGYVEIQYPKARRRIIDEEHLMGLTGASSRAMLQQLCRQQVEAALERKLMARQNHWTESIAVGSLEYIEALQKQVAIRAKGREVISVEGGCQLRERDTAYRGAFQGQKGGLSLENTFFWKAPSHNVLA